MKIVKTNDIANLIVYPNPLKKSSGLRQNQRIPEINGMKNLVFLTKRGWGFNHAIHTFLTDNFSDNSLNRIFSIFPLQNHVNNFLNHFKRNQEAKYTVPHDKLIYPEGQLRLFNSLYPDNLRGIQTQLVIYNRFSELNNVETVLDLGNWVNRLGSKYNNLNIIHSHKISPLLRQIIKQENTFTILGGALDNLDNLHSEYVRSLSILED